MVRKQLNIDDELDRAIEAKARELGISQSELVRQAVEKFLEDLEREEGLAALERLKAMWAEDDRLGIGSGPEGRTWKREDLYDRWEYHHGHEHPDICVGQEDTDET